MKSFLVLLVLFPTLLDAQQKNMTNKGEFWMYYGFNWDLFTHSDLSLRGAGYDFTLAKLRATGDQRLSYPQYNYRVGYYFKNNWALSFGLDHMKYIVKNNQVTTITGYIDSSSSKNFAGVFHNQPFTLTDNFLHYEHTDGLNYVSIELDYSRSHILSADSRFSYQLMAGPGIAVLIPRTDVTLFGHRINNAYHVSGWGTAVKAGSRLNMFHYIFIQGEVKAGYIHLGDVLLTGDTKDRGRQSFGFIEAGVYLGASVKL